MSIQNESLYIIGAGSSAEYNLPIWKALQGELKTLLLSNKIQIEKRGSSLKEEDRQGIIDLLDLVGKNYNTLDQMISQECLTLQYGVDIENVIWDHVAYILLKEEVNAKKIIDKGEDWLTSIKNSIIIDSKNDIEKTCEAVSTFFKNNTFLIYNYDRIVEYVFWEKLIVDLRDNNTQKELQQKFNILQDLTSIISSKIFHPHSDLGTRFLQLKEKQLYLHTASILEYRKKSSSDGWEFGTENEGRHINSSKGLMSCYDCSQDSEIINRFNRRGSTYQKIYIMGIGTMGLEENLNKIIISHPENVQKILYTCFEERDQPIYETYLKYRFPNAVLNKIKTCSEFYRI
ncbi:MAG: hypothetical protein KA028_02075 [Candidatus Pacebacteria bacterium]|nr:hypothetical protein [Candidatus Paceibacterota bacterium]